MTYPNVYATQTGPLALSSLDANFLYAVDIANGALSATAGGTADALTATYSPAPAALVAGLTLYLRAASANATTTPQFSPNGLTGKVIVKNNNQALAVGDIAGAGHWLHLVYDATNGVWELMNPATFIGAVQTGGTANGVAYLNASKVLTTGTALTFDGTNFATTGTATAAKLIPTGSSVTGNGLYLPAANSLGLSTNGTNAVYIDASQNVGIGVTPSAWALSGQKVLQVLNASLTGYTTDEATLTGNAYHNGTNWRYIASNWAEQYVMSSGTHKWYITSSGTAGAAITWTQAMTLDASGRLLIGTTSASGSNYLQVNSDASIYGLTVGRGAGAVAGNSAFGTSALLANTTGSNNTGIGYQALTTNTTGGGNTAIGFQAAYLGSGFGNIVAIGSNALSANTANDNIAIGVGAAQANTSGTNNTVVGRAAFTTNTTGGNNTALGHQALQANTTASNNTAVGYQALYANTTGSENTAVGYQAGYSNTTGTQNVYLGNIAGYTDNGTANIFIGFKAGYNSAVGVGISGGNLAIGYQAGISLTTGKSNTFVGGTNASTGLGPGYYVTTGSKNTILGGYNGNQSGLDIRTSSNYIVLSDGDGNVRQTIDPSGNAQFQAGAVMPYAPAPAAISAATTLTNANIQGQIISATGTTYTITMALGTTLETLATWSTTNIGYDFFVINTATGVITMAVNTGVTSLGSLTVAIGASAHFRLRRTAANTFVLYRLV